MHRTGSSFARFFTKFSQILQSFVLDCVKITGGLLKGFWSYGGFILRSGNPPIFSAPSGKSASDPKF